MQHLEKSTGVARCGGGVPYRSARLTFFHASPPRVRKRDLRAQKWRSVAGLRGSGYEFQETCVSSFLRDSHSPPFKIRGVTSIKRGMSRKTLAAVHGAPLRVL